jgi:hypothetical protein
MYIGPLIDNIFCSWNKLTGQNNHMTEFAIDYDRCEEMHNKMNIHLRTFILKVISLNIVII